MCTFQKKFSKAICNIFEHFLAKFHIMKDFLRKISYHAV
eukprot:UN02399